MRAGRGGIHGFTAAPGALLDGTPLAVAVALLAVVLVIRRTEAVRAPLAVSDHS